MTATISIEDVAAIASAAGDAALRLYQGSGAWVRQKQDGSPVTAADMAAEQVIRGRLEALDPDIPYLSEEAPLPAHAERRDWPRFWLVDPLDGTQEFLRRTDEFTVNIALIEAGEPVLGAVAAPALGVVYYAARRQGAWKRRPGLRPERIRSRLADPREPLRVVESRSHPSPDLEGLLAAYTIKERLQVGSSLKFCLLAEGRADIYPRLGPTMEWDVGAGDCVYRHSAEGAPHPSPFTYNKPSLRNGGFVLGLRTGPPGSATRPPRSS